MLLAQCLLFGHGAVPGVLQIALPAIAAFLPEQLLRRQFLLVLRLDSIKLPLPFCREQS